MDNPSHFQDSGSSCFSPSVFMEELPPSWQEQLQQEIDAPYMKELYRFLEQERAHKRVYPREGQVFNAFFQTPFDQVKVVLIGQDPYHGKEQAEGLSFSVPAGVRIPPSLRNIFLELERDLGMPIPANGSLLTWARQGVLLLNATLTVREGEPQSHQKRGWERFTDAVVRVLNERKDPLIFVLWGKAAQEKCQGIKNHLVLTAPHPSPYSAHTGFLGCRHFSVINQCLEKWGKKPIIWSESGG